MKKMQGGIKTMQGRYVKRVFGNIAKHSKKFWVKTKSGQVEVVEIGWMSKWLRPKVVAWWKANVVQYKAISILPSPGD